MLSVKVLSPGQFLALPIRDAKQSRTAWGGTVLELLKLCIKNFSGGEEASQFLQQVT